MNDKPFTKVNLDHVLRADSDGMPVFRKCFEHETLMSFFDDSGNDAFNDWWYEEGAILFNKWYEQYKDEYQ